MILENKIIGFIRKSPRTSRIFDLEMMQAEIARVNEKKPAAFVFMGNGTHASSSIPLDMIVGHAMELRIDDDKIVADIRIIRTPMGLVFETLQKEDVEVEFYLSGMGILDKDNNVSDYQITGIGYHTDRSKFAEIRENSDESK